MIDFTTNTLTRRYTTADILGHGSDGLSKAMISAQNRQVGFDPTNKAFPIRRVCTFDAVLYSQGQGPVLIGETEYVLTKTEENNAKEMV